MGKIKLGMAITDIRGSVGGHVLLKGRGGAIVRANNGQVKRISGQQYLLRQGFATSAKNWRALTVQQRDSWNNAVQYYISTDVFGDVKTPSGFSLYQKLNQYVILSSGSPLSNVPAIFTLIYPRFFTPTYSVSGASFTIVVSPANAQANCSYILYCSRPLSLGVRAFNQRTKRMVIGAVGGTFSNVYATYNVFFPNVKVGQQILCMVKVFNTVTGIFSAPIWGFVTVTA